MVRYDAIGKGYNITRRADPYITERVYDLLQPVAGGLYLDVGCGTANYLTALAAKGLSFYGVDPSDTMLNVAKVKNNNALFIKGKAESLPLQDAMFDGAIAMFTLHHWDDITAGLAEVHRVLKPGAHIVFLTFTPEQLMGYWLCHYFPEMMRRSAATIPHLSEMKDIFSKTGLELLAEEKYFIQDDLQDHFLYSNKRRPEQYLIPEVRNNASSFSAFSDSDEVASGLKLLEEDINTGRVNDIMKKYENDLGDYLFLVAGKPAH